MPAKITKEVMNERLKKAVPDGFRYIIASVDIQKTKFICSMHSKYWQILAEGW